MDSFTETARPRAEYASKADYVAQRLLDRIVSADLAPGQTLGTEADLLSQYDVSRPTLRESLRILESQGVLELRPGPRGGIVVSKPGTDILAHGLSVYLRMNDVPFSAILQALETIQPALASGAAENGTEEEYALLDEALARMKAAADPSGFAEETRRFHSILARASRNQVMAIFWSTISVLSTGEAHGVRYTAPFQKQALAAHAALIEALRGRDGAAAAARMAEHVEALATLVRTRHKALLDQSTAIVGRNGRAMG